MQINLLKKIVEKTAGLQAVKIVDLLYEKKNINEFLIAKKLSLTINQTRNLLYRLSHMGIISSTRKKDKRKGWYIYFWTFNVLKSLELLEDNLKKEILNMQNQLMNKRQKRFYKCAICGREVNEEAALLTEFMCLECGEVYALADNTAMIEGITKQIEHLEREAKVVSEEIDREKEKKGKKLVRFLKREAVKKKLIRKNKRESKKKKSGIKKKSKPKSKPRFKSKPKKKKKL